MSLSPVECRWPGQSQVGAFGYSVVLLAALVGLALLPWRGRFKVIDLRLSRPGGSTCEQVLHPPLLRLEADGGYSFGGRRLAAAELPDAIHADFNLSVEKLVAVGSAPERTFGEFIQVAGVARGAGAYDVGFADSAGVWCQWPID